MLKESRTLEYKREVSDFGKIAKTVIAFANGLGGEILVGIEDKSRKIIGLSPNVIDDLLERLPISLADQIRPPLFPLIYTKAIDSREIVVVQIFPGTQKPYFLASEGLERGVYVRVGPHTRRAEGEVLEELRLLRQHITYDQAPEPRCSQAELEFERLPPALRTEKSRFSLDILRRDAHTAEIYPTRGAVLMLHPTPEKYIPEASIILSKIRGISGRSTTETHTITGPIPVQAEIALDILLRWLGREPKLKKGKYLNQKTLIPLEALREALHNALFHRQYSIPGAIKIALFANRLEIFSPGHFAGPFIPSSLGDGTSYIRNPVICSIARRLGLIEKRGTGISTIQTSLKNNGLPEAHFEEGPNWFKVTLFSEADKNAATTTPEEKIIELLESRADISSKDVCLALGVSKATAVAHIERLISGGTLIKTGAGPKTKYRLAGD